MVFRTLSATLYAHQFSAFPAQKQHENAPINTSVLKKYALHTNKLLAEQRKSHLVLSSILSPDDRESTSKSEKGLPRSSILADQTVDIYALFVS